LQLLRGKKLNGMTGYNSASGTLFRLKLTEDIEQKLRKTMLALFDHSLVLPGYKDKTAVFGST